MSPPLVSVLTTAYNREAYIAQCIESVLASDFTDFEYIVVDDRSTDSTYEIAKSYEPKDSRLKVLQNESNLGDYPNRNRAATLAAGTYLKFLDSDDVIYPHGLGTMVDFLRQFPEAVLALSEHADPDRPHPLLLSPLEAYRRHFFKTGLLGRAPGSVIIERGKFLASGGFSGTNQVGDHECWLKLAAAHPVVTMPPALVWDRLHPDQQQKADDTNTKARMHYDVMLAALNAPGCPFDECEKLAALAAARTRDAKSRVLPLLARGKLPQALSARRTLGLTASEVIAAVLNRRPPLDGYKSLLGVTPS